MSSRSNSQSSGFEDSGGLASLVSNNSPQNNHTSTTNSKNNSRQDSDSSNSQSNHDSTTITNWNLNKLNEETRQIYFQNQKEESNKEFNISLSSNDIPSKSSNPKNSGASSNDADNEKSSSNSIQSQKFNIPFNPPRNGKWSKREHRKFLEAIKLYGKNWVKVQQYVQTRTKAQAKSHGQRLRIRLEKKCSQKYQKILQILQTSGRSSNYSISAELKFKKRNCAESSSFTDDLDAPFILNKKFKSDNSSSNSGPDGKHSETKSNEEMLPTSNSLLLSNDKSPCFEGEMKAIEDIFLYSEEKDQNLLSPREAKLACFSHLENSVDLVSASDFNDTSFEKINEFIMKSKRMLLVLSTSENHEEIKEKINNLEVALRVQQKLFQLKLRLLITKE